MGCSRFNTNIIFPTGFVRYGARMVTRSQYSVGGTTAWTTQFATQKMAIEIVDLPIKNSDFPQLVVCLPEGTLHIVVIYSTTSWKRYNYSASPPWGFLYVPVGPAANDSNLGLSDVSLPWQDGCSTNILIDIRYLKEIQRICSQVVHLFDTSWCPPVMFVGL